jgi:FAD:protein FMN transferase
MGAAATGTAAGLHTETWAALGTTAVLRHIGPADPAVRQAVDDEIAAIDRAASRFRPDSELSRVNAGAGAWVPVSALFAEALVVALGAADISGGAVDPALGASLEEIGYDRDWRQLAAIDADAPLCRDDRLVVHRRRRGEWRSIGLRRDPPAVRVPRGVSLDLGATAKALAADRAAAAARTATDVGVLVALGGDIATSGPAPAGGWLVHVTDDHRDGPGAPGQTIAIRSGGLATSSIVARRWSHGGRTMHHILDPRDGRPVRPKWRTVSVAAASCVDANIASTAAIVLGSDAMDWLAAQGMPARLVELDGTARTCAGWPS